MTVTGLHVSLRDWAAFDAHHRGVCDSATCPVCDRVRNTVAEIIAEQERAMRAKRPALRLIQGEKR